MSRALDNTRKAAILIDTLDQPSADALLDQMGPEQADRVRQAVMELERVSADERERVLSEFLGRQQLRHRPAEAASLMENDGVELEVSLAARMSQAGDESENEAVAKHATEPPFAFLLEADSEVIARFLNLENPQVTAVVLAHIPPQRSADVLARLAPERQTDVIRRLVHLSETSPEVLQDVEQELGNKLSEQLRTSDHREEGLAAIRRIFAAADVNLQKDLLPHMTAADASLNDPLCDTPKEVPPPAEDKWQVPRTAVSSPARETPRPAQRRPAIAATEPAAAPTRDEPITPPLEVIRRRQIAPLANSSRAASHSGAEFADLAQLGDAELCNVFSTVGLDVAVLALTAAEPRFARRITKALPKPIAKKIAKLLAHPSPMRLSDVERAQREVVRVAEGITPTGSINQTETRGRLAAVA